MRPPPRHALRAARDHRVTAVNGVAVFIAHAIGIAIFAAIVGTFLMGALAHIRAAFPHLQ